MPCTSTLLLEEDHETADALNLTLISLSPSSAYHLSARIHRYCFSCFHPLFVPYFYYSDFTHSQGFYEIAPFATDQPPDTVCIHIYPF